MRRAIVSQRSGQPALVITAALAAAAVHPFLTIAARAGEYHTPGQGDCSDCHTAHASIRGEASMPSAHLLKNAGGQVPLCMSCHDGTNLQAPDIVSSGSAAVPSALVTTRYTSKYGPSAGVFQGDHLCTPNPAGHDLAPSASPVAPLSTSYRRPGGLACSDCHATHGNANYRNLLTDPNPAHPGAVTLLLGTDVKEETLVDAATPNPSVAYDTDNVSFYARNNINAWCTDCHDKLDQNAVGTAPAHFRSHPTGVTIGGAVSHTDVNNWVSPSLRPTSGFGLDIGDSIAGIPRVRYGSLTASNTIASSSDMVLCLSCHKAHGSQHKSAIVWPLHRAGADMLSGCQQCHHK